MKSVSFDSVWITYFHLYLFHFFFSFSQKSVKNRIESIFEHEDQSFCNYTHERVCHTR